MYKLKNTLDYPNNLLANIGAYKNDIDPSDIACVTNVPEDTTIRIQNVLDSLKYCWFCDEDILEVFFGYFIKHKSIEELSIEVKWNKSLVVDRITNIIKVLSLDLYYNIIFNIDDPGIWYIEQTYIRFDKRFSNALKRFRDNYEFNNAGIETVQDIKVFLKRNNNNFAALGKIRGIGEQSIEGIKLLIELFDKYFKVEILLDDSKNNESESCSDSEEDLRKEVCKLRDKVNLLEVKNLLNDCTTTSLVVNDLKTDEILKVARKDLMIKAIDLLLKEYD